VTHRRRRRRKLAAPFVAAAQGGFLKMTLFSRLLSTGPFEAVASLPW